MVQSNILTFNKLSWEQVGGVGRGGGGVLTGADMSDQLGLNLTLVSLTADSCTSYHDNHTYHAIISPACPTPKPNSFSPFSLTLHV